MHKKEPQKPPEHTSEHVNSQFSGGVPPDPPHTTFIMSPTFCIYPGPLQSSQRPCFYVNSWHSNEPSTYKEMFVIANKTSPYIRHNI